MHKTSFTYEQIMRAYSLSQVANINFNLALEKILGAERKSQLTISALKALDPRKMTKKEVIEATRQMPELPQELYNMLSSEGGFRTGSTVYGANPKAANDEDWCVILPPSVFKEYSIGQSDQGYWEADGFSSVYCHRNGVLLNILCFSDLNLYNAWLYTTNTMQWLMTLQTVDPHKSGIEFASFMQKKWQRVRLFRALKDIFYTPKPLRVSLEKEEALKYTKCRTCGQEATNFTCKAAKDHYQQTGTCERCSGLTY